MILLIYHLKRHFHAIQGNMEMLCWIFVCIYPRHGQYFPWAGENDSIGSYNCRTCMRLSQEPRAWYPWLYQRPRALWRLKQIDINLWIYLLCVGPLGLGIHYWTWHFTLPSCTLSNKTQQFSRQQMIKIETPFPQNQNIAFQKKKYSYELWCSPLGTLSRLQLIST